MHLVLKITAEKGIHFFWNFGLAAMDLEYIRISYFRKKQNRPPNCTAVFTSITKTMI